MAECKNRRATKPFNATAIVAANRTQPTVNCYAEREKWFDAYIAAGGAWECADPSGKKLSDIEQKCLHEKMKKKQDEQEERRKELMKRVKEGNSKLIVTGSDDFKNKTYASLDKISKTPTGFKLLEGLDGGAKSTTIQETAAGNTETAASWADGLYDTANNKPGSGTDATVKFNPDRDRLNGESWHTRDPAIGLGHELIHAYHDTRGTTDGRPSVVYRDPANRRRDDPGYELQTVGLGTYAHDDLTENKLRRDFCNQGLSSKGTESQRPHY